MVSIVAALQGTALDCAATMTTSVITPGVDGPATFEGTNGNFHLKAEQSAIAAVAVWQEGDPATDIDGDARPNSGYPGIDEP